MDRSQEQIIFDCLGRLLRAADEDQKLAKSLLDQLQNQLNQYEYKQNKFRDEVGIKLASTLNESTFDIVESFKSVKKNAINAAAEYEKAGKRAAWRMTWAGIGLILLSAIIFYGFLFLYLPSPQKIEALIDEQNTLQNNIDTLKSNGALMRFSYCGPKRRGCAKFDKASSAETFGTDSSYLILDGY